MAKRVVGVCLSPGVIRRLDRLAKAVGMSRSSYLEKLVIDVLSETEMSVRVMTDPKILGPLVEVLAKPEWVRSMATAMGEQLSDRQLDLFAQGMQQLSKNAGKQGKGRK